MKDKKKKIQGKKNRQAGARFERDELGKFVRGHKPLGTIDAMIEYNKKHSVWNKGKKLLPLSMKRKKENSKKMKERHKNPTWNEEERRRKISDKLIGHKHSDKTKEILRKKGKRSKQQGTNFEYRAKKFMENWRGVKQVIRMAGSRDIDLVTLWCIKKGLFKITKEEVKSSLSWFNTISKNPLTLLGKDDKEKLRNAINMGFECYLIYRKPKEKEGGGYMLKQTEILRLKLKLEDLK